METLENSKHYPFSGMLSVVFVTVHCRSPDLSFRDLFTENAMLES